MAKNTDYKKTVIRHLYGNYRYRCKKRNVYFDLTVDEFVSIILKNCFYCDKRPNNRHECSGVFLKYSGIDRKNNKAGYYIGNCVPCCKRCNQVKGSVLTHQEMIKVAEVLQSKHAKKIIKKKAI